MFSATADRLDFFEGHFGTWNLEGDRFTPVTYGIRPGIVSRIRRLAAEADGTNAAIRRAGLFPRTAGLAR